MVDKTLIIQKIPERVARFVHCLSFVLFFLLLHPLCAEEKKVLVVVLAETRSHEVTYDNFYKNVIQPLNADLAVCLGVKENYDYSNPYFQSAKYRFTYPEPEDYTTAYDYAYNTILKENPDIKEPFYWRKFLKIKDQFLGGIKDPQDQHPGAGGILIFFRWFLLQNLLQHQLLEKYDFFVITRSDFLYTLPHPSISVFSEDCIYLPDGEFYGGVTDRHVVLPRKFVISYLNMINQMVARGKEYYDKMQGRFDWNTEQVVKLHLIENGVWQHVRFFPYVMYAVRLEGGTYRWARGEYSSELGYYIKYLSEYQGAHFLKRQFEIEKKWISLDQFYRNRIRTADD